jgi:two-component system, chemotaxis family, response regulator Rcp1
MSVELLLVEESPGDVRLTREAFRYANNAVKLHVAPDSAEAMAFLRQEGTHVGAPRPDLSLLELNSTKMDGREVLALIKEDEALETIPTVVPSTSGAEHDVVKSYQLHAHCHLTKPAQCGESETLVKIISEFRLAGAELPDQPRNE